MDYQEVTSNKGGCMAGNDLAAVLSPGFFGLNEFSNGPIISTNHCTVVHLSISLARSCPTLQQIIPLVASFTSCDCGSSTLTSLFFTR